MRPLKTSVLFNHEALLVSDGARMCDEYDMVRLVSTSDIPRLKRGGADDYSSACLYGGIDYDESTAFEFHRNADRGVLGLLYNTGVEVDSVCGLLTRSGVRTNVMKGDCAVEADVRMSDGQSSDILHFATHAFFVSDSIAYGGEHPFFSHVWYSSPSHWSMVKSGLFMAGANKTWTGIQRRTSASDGILTSDEISRIDLSNTKLVVLSACSTGLGISDGANGMLGLQKAFKKAGVKTVVMSLWKVNDAATSCLMQLFYKYLLGGDIPREALRKAQREMKSRPEYSSPYYWAPFIVLD